MNLKLVPYNPSFFDLVYSWRSQATVLRHNPIVSLSKDEYAVRAANDGNDLSDLSGLSKSQTKFSDYRWYVDLEGEIVGNVSLKTINLAMMTAEIGYGISELHQRRGVATCAVKLLELLQIIYGLVRSEWRAALN